MTGFNGKKPSIPQKDISKVFHRINCLGQEINNLGRIIKIWEIIVNSIKKFKQLKYESFFGCIQNQFNCHFKMTIDKHDTNCF